MMKNNRGVALATLIIAVVVMLVIAGTITYTSLDSIKLRRLDDMYNDIRLLKQKVTEYYIENDSLPILENIVINSTNYIDIEDIIKNKETNEKNNKNDSDDYHILDLTKLGRITLKYGKDYEYYNNKNITELDSEKKDIYIINEQSHTIYYLSGIKIKLEGIETTKYALDESFAKIDLTLPEEEPTPTPDVEKPTPTPDIDIEFNTEDLYVYDYDNDNYTAVLTGVQEGVTLNGAYSLPAQTISDGETYTVTSIADSAFAGCDKVTHIAIEEGIIHDSDCGLKHEHTEDCYSACDRCNTMDGEGRCDTTFTVYGEDSCPKCGTPYSCDCVYSGEEFGECNCGGMEVTCNEWYECQDHQIILDCPYDAGECYCEEYEHVLTRIGDSAFAYCASLESIEIPESVTSIGWMAFEDCSNLINIDVEEENNNYMSIDGILFNNEQTRIIRYPSGKKDTSYTIPDSVKLIADGAFEGCKSLVTIEIPKEVTSIGNYVFMNCINLKDINIHEGITDIGECAFESCSALTNITIPNSVTSIWYDAFLGCDSLATVKILNSETYMPGDVFYNDSGNLTIYGYVGSTAEEYVDYFNQEYTDYYNPITFVPLEN